MKKLLVVSAILFQIRTARANEVEIVAVMWQQDLSVRDTVEQFYGCLVNSSTFGTTWAQQFGLTRVTFRGVYVLSDPCPQQARLSGNMRTLLVNAFDAGTLPAPSSGGTSYLLYLPTGVQGYDQSGIPACQGTYCGVHGSTSYRGTVYDAALVPIDCADCGSVQVTLIGEHEAAEAIANLGNAQFEVGDDCEGPRHTTQLACCGTSYPIQQLSSNRSPTDCQTINATGNMCGCAMLHSACTMQGDCCSGLSCSGMVCCVDSGGTCATRADCCGALECNGGHCAQPPPPDAGTTPDASTGMPDASGGSGGAGGGSGGAGGNNGNGGETVTSGGCSVQPTGESGLALLLSVLAASSARRCARRAARRRAADRGRRTAR